MERKENGNSGIPPADRMKFMKDIVIIGNGPAGISAAIYAVRGGAKATVIAKDSGALGKAGRIENYYGFPDGVDAAELIAAGVRQAENLGAAMLSGEVFGIEFGGNGYLVKTDKGDLPAGAVIIACGVSRNTPKIKDLEKFEGRGVSWCAVCDGFFFRGRKVAVVGSGPYAESEYGVLKRIIQDVTILTNGETPSFPLPCDTRRIASVEGGDTLSAVVFEDGTREAFDGVFIACGSAGPFELSKKTGLRMENNRLVVNEKRETNIPGIYAAGDCTPGMQQIARAVCDGMIAGTEALRYVKKRP